MDPKSSKGFNKRATLTNLQQYLKLHTPKKKTGFGSKKPNHTNTSFHGKSSPHKSNMDIQEMISSHESKEDESRNNYFKDQRLSKRLNTQS